MKREHFAKVAEEVLDSLPQEFRSRICNVAVLEDMPPNQPSPQPGQQTIQDIQTDMATAQTTIQDAGARQAQSQSMLQNIVNTTETVSTDQVASEILALQNSLQASYQTTSMLSQLTLTKYLPVG